MEIRFISSLTADDENMFAPALLKAVGTLLDQLPIAYTMRIETTGEQVYQHTHALPERAESPAESVGRSQRIQGQVLSREAGVGRESLGAHALVRAHWRNLFPWPSCCCCRASSPSSRSRW